jgi:hypothetical protein
MWKDIIKNQITSAKQGVLTSDSTLPKKNKPKDCYPPLYALFQQFIKLQNILDPSKTLIMNWDHGFTPEELCILKNRGIARYKHVITGDSPSGVGLLYFYIIAGTLSVEFTIKFNLHKVHFIDNLKPDSKENYANMPFHFMVETHREFFPLGKESSKLDYDCYPSAVAGDEIQQFMKATKEFFANIKDYAVESEGSIGEEIFEFWAERMNIVHKQFSRFYPELDDMEKE